MKLILQMKKLLTINKKMINNINRQMKIIQTKMKILNKIQLIKINNKAKWITILNKIILKIEHLLKVFLKIVNQKNL